MSSGFQKKNHKKLEEPNHTRLLKVVVSPILIPPWSRTLGFYFLRTYFPLVIIVTSSWVSFWLVKTPAGGEIVARVGLGITCCLAVVTVGSIGDNKDKPKVSYATAMDVYIIICFAFVFMALVEFAFIHFVEMYVRRVKFKVGGLVTQKLFYKFCSGRIICNLNPRYILKPFFSY